MIAIGSSENNLVVTTLAPVLRGGQSQSSASFSSENSLVVTTLVVTSPLRLKSLLLGGQSQSAASFSSENSFIGTATLLRDGWSSPGTTQAWMPALPGIALRRLPNSAAKSLSKLALNRAIITESMPKDSRRSEEPIRSGERLISLPIISFK